MRTDSLDRARLERGSLLRPRSTRWAACALLLCTLAGCGRNADPDTRTDSATTGLSESSPLDSASARIDGDLPVAEPDWTTASVRVQHQTVGPVTVSEVRIARHEGFDRFVITLLGDSLPSYRAAMTGDPPFQCGSGEPATVSGEAVLTFDLELAQAHDESGNSTLEVRDTLPGLPALREVRVICDFEGHVAWAFGIGDATAFRVLELSDPSRIAVDIQH